MIIRAQSSIDAPQPKLWSRAVCIFDWYEFLQARTSNTNFWQSRADFDLKLGWDTTSSQDEQKTLRELSDSSPLKPSNIDFTYQMQILSYSVISRKLPKPNFANKALWELKSRSVINIAMISDNPSPELDWCPTAKVMVKTSLHFAGFEFWQGSSFKH